MPREIKVRLRINNEFYYYTVDQLIEGNLGIGGFTQANHSRSINWTQG